MGLAVHRAARSVAAAHGGQIPASRQTAELVIDDMPAGLAVLDLGEHPLKGLERPEHLYQVSVEGIDANPLPAQASETAPSSQKRSARHPHSRAARDRIRSEAPDLRRRETGRSPRALLLNANHVVSVDQLIDEVWGDEPPASGAKAVQVRVSQLRKAFVEAGIGELISTRPPGYVIELGTEDLDLNRFESLVAESDQAVANSDPARRRAAEALGLWRGSPLAEFASSFRAARARTARGAAARRRRASSRSRPRPGTTRRPGR